MSVPLFFTAVEIDDHLFVDGGATFDYPLLAFGNVGISNTLGLAFAGSSSAAAGDQDETSFGYHQPGEYIHRMLTVLERIQAPLLALYGGLRDQTILIDTGDISSLQFKLSKDDQAITEDWLEEYNAIRPHEALGHVPPYQYALKQP